MRGGIRSVGVGVSVVMAGLVASVLAQVPVVRPVAFLKASNADAGDHFGNGGTLLGDSVAISGDGNTIAVGAPHEASNAAGIMRTRPTTPTASAPPTSYA